MDAAPIAAAAETGLARLCTLSGWSDLGQAVGGFATAVGVGFAIYTVSVWRDQKAAEKRSDAAANALSTIRDACVHVHNWTGVVLMGLMSEAPTEEKRRELVQFGAKWGARQVRPLEESLQASSVPAYIHLDEAERKMIWEASTLLFSLQTDLAYWIKQPAMPSVDDMRSIAMNHYRVGDALLARAEAVLRPVARFAATESPPWVRKLQQLWEETKAQ